MLKLDSLRNALVAANEKLKVDPDQLKLFVDNGKIVASATGGLGFEYRYTGTIFLLEFAGHPDAIFLPLLAWVRSNQPELLTNLDKAAEAISFEAEILDDDASDITITLPLTETVTAVKRQDGGYDLTHADERPIDDALAGFFGDPVDSIPASTHLVELYVDGELIGHAPPP